MEGKLRKSKKKIKGKIKEKKKKRKRKTLEREGKGKKRDQRKTKKDGILDLEGPSLTHTSPLKLKFKASFKNIN